MFLNRSNVSFRLVDFLQSVLLLHVHTFRILGMVQGKTYKTPTGQYVTKANVLSIDKNTVVHASTKEPLTVDWAKMSKSKYNGVDPQDIIDQYGVDFTRILMLNFVHPRSLRNFTCKSDTDRK